MFKKLTIFVVILVSFLTILFLNLWILLSISLAGSIDIGSSLISSINDANSLYLNYESTFGSCEFSSKFRYEKTNDIETQNNLYFKFGYDSLVNEKWSLWLFDEAGYNKIQGIDLENFAGAGPKYTFLNTKTRKVSISFGYLPHFQQFEDYSKTTNRLSLRLKGKDYVEKDYEIKIILFYQPNLEDFDDYLLSGEFFWKYRLVGSTSVKISVTDQYRSMSEIEKNELIGMLALSFEL